MSTRTSVIALVVLTALMILGCLFVPRIPQPHSYHLFADSRSCFGIPNFANIVSNAPFAVIGLWGLALLLTRPMHKTPYFGDQRERWPYIALFAGLLLTALGSSYYHLNPNNATLVWDRLPMTIVFMSMAAAMIAERISVKAGLWLLPVLLIIGLGSVAQWHISELNGSGDLRFYAAVQVYSMAVLLVALLFPPKYTRGADLAIVLGFYVLAKVFEVLDERVFRAGHLVSGHTIKHLLAAAAGYWIVRMLQKRKLLLTSDTLAATSGLHPDQYREEWPGRWAPRLGGKLLFRRG